MIYDIIKPLNWKEIQIHVYIRIKRNQLTNPVNISNIKAPSDHQSTALPCPLRVKISGALENSKHHMLV